MTSDLVVELFKGKSTSLLPLLHIELSSLMIVEDKSWDDKDLCDADHQQEDG